MIRIIVTMLASVLAAVLMHGLVILFMPRFGAINMVSVVELAGGGRDVVPLDNETSDLPDIAFSDPTFRHFACAYDLAEGPYRTTAQGRAAFWTLAVFDQSNTNRFSTTGDDDENTTIDFVIATQRQKNRLAETASNLAENTIIAVVPDGEGAIVLRIFRPDASYDGLIKAFADSMECTLLQL